MHELETQGERRNGKASDGDMRQRPALALHGSGCVVRAVHRGGGGCGARSIALAGVRIELPYPPSLNSYYRTVKGRILISAEGRAYRKTVADYVMESRTAAAMAGRMAVEITVYPPDRRRRDLDNVAKCLLDSLTKAGVWRDDEQIDMLMIRRALPVFGGRVLVHACEVAA